MIPHNQTLDRDKTTHVGYDDRCGSTAIHEDAVGVTVENRYRHADAAKQIGASKNTINRWEKRAQEVRERVAAGLPVETKDRIWTAFPMPKRNAHSRHRVFTDEDIKAIKAWKERTTDLVA